MANFYQVDENTIINLDRVIAINQSPIDKSFYVMFSFQDKFALEEKIGIRLWNKLKTLSGSVPTMPKPNITRYEDED